MLVLDSELVSDLELLMQSSPTLGEHGASFFSFSTSKDLKSNKRNETHKHGTIRKYEVRKFHTLRIERENEAYHKQKQRAKT